MTTPYIKFVTGSTTPQDIIEKAKQYQQKSVNEEKEKTRDIKKKMKSFLLGETNKNIKISS